MLDTSASDVRVQEMDREIGACMGHPLSVLLWHIAVS